MRVAAIVLAAGSSSRLGRPKQDLVFEGETLLTRAVRLAHVVAGEIVVVTRENNPDAEEGIASSIRVGVTLAPSDARLLVLLCDQPRITTAHVRALIETDAPIAASGYNGIAGVPAIFAPEYREELLALRGDRGARVVIEAHRDVVAVLPFEDAAIDIDTEEDVARVIPSRHGRRRSLAKPWARCTNLAGLGESDDTCDVIGSASEGPSPVR